ncbi:DUF3298 and DUF4163 domain-containing protein [Pedobacter sp. MC2016-24]|uniref:DUF3298 and DUF4163 domain-containing protein n=1 Tax=Pedobacter sp. MC2016-24 TaxID=2780090 RepID=UPI00187ED84A|nr:DUF3298 and DUF4163 domain-containing protein [Pedobacter sp. MC2016-24]MBE9601465.1 DUF3298 domain-containing protein [Pedobacter sp. MC2016-24]
MKSNYIIPFCISIALSACHGTDKQKTTATNSVDSTATHVATVQEHLPSIFYKRLQGIIGDQNVIVQLSRTGNSFSGNYDFNGKRLDLVTDTVIGTDSLVLKEESLQSYTEKAPKGAKLHLKWTGSAFEGFRMDGKNKQSIHLEERYPQGTYPFELAAYEDSLQAYPKRKNSPMATINFQYLSAKGKTSQEVWLDKQLKKIVGFKNPDIAWTTGIQKLAKEYLEGYKADMAEIPKEDAFSATLNYSHGQNVTLEYNENGYVVINELSDDYSGGAHGNYGSSIYNFDVQNQKLLKLNDIVKIDSLPLQGIIEKNFRKQYQIPEGEGLSTQLFDDHLAASKNFIVGSHGLSFLYNPYEVASYAQGQILVYIPYADLRKQLNPDFVKRMQIN